MTVNMTDTYEEVCEASIDDLYRVAYIALGSREAAAETVTETCVACVHICEHLHGRTDIRTALFSELSGRCERKLSLPPAHDSDFPETLRSVDPYKRLHLAMNLAAVQ